MFAIVEGFYYTKSKEKYMIRLYTGSAFMGIFNYLIVEIFPRADSFLILNNIFGTFFLTVFYLYYIERVKENKFNNKSVFSLVLIMFVPILLSLISPLITLIAYRFRFNIPANVYVLLNGLIPSSLFVEGGPFLVILGIIMYRLRHDRIKQIIIYMVFCIVSFSGSKFSIQNLLYTNYQWMMVFSAIFMLMYNGDKGKGYKFLFYVFYPVHIYILYILSVIIIFK
jgi:hypothetical protein